MSNTIVVRVLDTDGTVLNPAVVCTAEFADATFPRWELVPDSVGGASPSIVVTSIDTQLGADVYHEVSISPTGMSEVTVPVNTTVVITSEFRDSLGNVLPVTDTFRMPVRSWGGAEKVVLAKAVDGVVTVSITMDVSGVWTVTDEHVNEGIPYEQRLVFGGFRVYVYE